MLHESQKLRKTKKKKLKKKANINNRKQYKTKIKHIVNCCFNSHNLKSLKPKMTDVFLFVCLHLGCSDGEIKLHEAFKF